MRTLECSPRRIRALWQYFPPILIIGILSSAGNGLAQPSAESYPSKPVTIIIPVSPGGAVDAEGRLYGQKLSESLGRQFVNDYKPGAGTTIGAAYVAKAPPDGYTLLAVSAGFVIAPSFYKSLPYDPERDIAPISQMSARPTVMAIHPGLPIKTPAEYIAYTKSFPGKLNVGTTGIGGSLHLAALWLDSVTGGRVTFVHYKGTGSMMSDLISGRVHAAPLTIPVALGQAKSGKLRLVGTASAKRSPALPDLPTFAEQGASGYDYSSWFGFAAPAGTPAPIINKLHAELVKAGKAPDIQKKMAADGATVVVSTPAEFGHLIKTEIARWRQLLKNENIKPR